MEKHYIPVKPTRDANALCIEVGYTKGGNNWYSGGTIDRGYYLYCTPVNLERKVDGHGREYNLVSQTIGAGYKFLLKEAARSSKKAEAEAHALAAEKEAWIVEETLKRYGLELAEVAV